MVRRLVWRLVVGNKAQLLLAIDHERIQLLDTSTVAVGAVSAWRLTAVNSANERLGCHWNREHGRHPNLMVSRGNGVDDLRLLGVRGEHNVVLGCDCWADSTAHCPIVAAAGNLNAC